MGETKCTVWRWPVSEWICKDTNGRRNSRCCSKWSWNTSLYSGKSFILVIIDLPIRSYFVGLWVAICQGVLSSFATSHDTTLLRNSEPERTINLNSNNDHISTPGSPGLSTWRTNLGFTPGLVNSVICYHRAILSIQSYSIPLSSHTQLMRRSDHHDDSRSTEFIDQEC